MHYFLRFFSIMYYFADEYVLLCQRIRLTLPTNTSYFAIEYVLLYSEYYR